MKDGGGGDIQIGESCMQGRTARISKRKVLMKGVIEGRILELNSHTHTHTHTFRHEPPQLLVLFVWLLQG